ncbi:proline dehydrogenase 1, mitochondrial-like isoform X2 [Lineus longissimus]|uniref:proline dehydrogenase 1, mitochondrial-like isoform X2 n=1 Tax=Lineus longissimus TaxID=88925 RepID=UPI002B4DC695
MRASLVLRLCSIEWIVNRNKEIMDWTRKVLGNRIFTWAMKATFFGHFVAGENQDDIKPAIARMQHFGVKSILDYSAEEDLSRSQAQDAEMESCLSAAEVGGDTPPPVGDKVKFRAHREFGDRRENVVSARTYFYEDEAHCDKNMDIFLSCIDAVSGSTMRTGFAAVKLTALGRPQLLLQMSEVLVHLRQVFNVIAGPDNTLDGKPINPTINLESFMSRLHELGIKMKSEEKKKWFTLLDTTKDGEIDLLDWHNILDSMMNLAKVLNVRNIQTGKPFVSCLKEEEMVQMENMLHRINTVVQHAKDKDVRVMIDAEQTYFQPSISRFTMEMMRKYNKEKAIVFNTYQCYLKDALNAIRVDLNLSARENFYFGAKLVRGAYMDQERLRAETLGYPDPINDTFEDTTAMYESVLDEVMTQINQRPRGEIAVMIASHNENTVRNTLEVMRQNNVKPSDRILCFGQLYGMCDQMSFPLGQAGYSVYKYVPFGPVNEVVPYLSRRAYENKGILKKVQKERRLLGNEIKRRLLKGQIFYDPCESHPPAPPI